MVARSIAILTLVSFLTVINGAAEAQDRNEALTCWRSYANCAREAFGSQNWRSICYADFAGCLGKAELPACPSDRQVADCTTYLSDCRELAAGDAALELQCDEDNDACLLAHGC